jgi:hypothetical protein
MTDWSAMAWEPCLLKHGPRYDDPWSGLSDQDDIEHPRKRRVFVVYGNGETIEYTSVAAAGRAVGFAGKMATFVNVRTHCRRMGARLI